MRRRLQIRGFGGCYAPIHHFYKNNEPRRKKTGRRGLRPDLTQTGLYSKLQHMVRGSNISVLGSRGIVLSL